MPSVTANHRPLFSGLKVTSRRPAPPSEAPGETVGITSGTLTGVATRDSDGVQVLVTNLHVLAGKTTTVSVGKKAKKLKNAAGDESLYQGDIDEAHRVGKYADSTQLTPGQPIDT